MYFQNAKCYTCGEPGHYSPACPAKRFKTYHEPKEDKEKPGPYFAIYTPEDNKEVMFVYLLKINIS